jgi:arsenate reductase
MKVAFICTGNTARSQLAEAIAKHYIKELKKDIQVFSAGSKPAGYINPFVKRVLDEVNIKLENQYSKSLNEIPLNKIDIFITLCDSAEKECPYIPNAKYIHYSLKDPVKFEKEEEKLKAFREVRDKLMVFLKDFIQDI